MLTVIVGVLSLLHITCVDYSAMNISNEFYGLLWFPYWILLFEALRVTILIICHCIWWLL